MADKDQIVCPYCGDVRDSSDSAIIVSEFDSVEECGHLVTCWNCDCEFEVCVQYELRVSTHRTYNH